MKGFRFNLEKFNQQLEKEIKNEEEKYSHLVSAKQLIKNQRLLNSLYTGAESMKNEVIEICAGTRATVKKIIESEPVQPQDVEQKNEHQLEAQYVMLDKELFKGLERLHQQVDRMQLDIKDSIKLIIDYKKAYEETYEKIPIEANVEKEKPKKKVVQA